MCPYLTAEYRYSDFSMERPLSRLIRYIALLGCDLVGDNMLSVDILALRGTESGH